MYRNKKGGKLQDRWLSYPVTKVNRSTVQVLRNNSLQRIKRSKVKLLKKQNDNTETPPSKFQRLSTLCEDVSSDENGKIPSSPFRGAEESIFQTNTTRKTRDEVFEFLNSMKSQILDYISTKKPLSKLHSELFDWRQEHFPPTEIPEMRLMDFDTSHEMTDILSQWYLDSDGIKIPYYQYTNEDFNFSTHWQQESMNYSTNVLQPVLNELIINTPETLPTTLNNVINSEYSLEDSTVTWGGFCDSIELVNTCSVDNIITLLSLNQEKLPITFEMMQYSRNLLLEKALSLIQVRQFDRLRLLVAQMLGIQLSNSSYNFLG